MTERTGASDHTSATVDRKGIGTPFVYVEGVHKYELWREGRCVESGEVRNKIITEGLDLLLDTLDNGGSATNPWYVSIFDSDCGTVDTLWVYDDYYDPAGEAQTEFSNYTEGNSGSAFSRRPEWEMAAASGGIATNTADKALFDISASGTIYGAMLCSRSTYTGDHDAAGVAMSISKFSSPISVLNGDTLKVTISITFTPA